MTDLVVTCPKGFWDEWVAEGDPAGEAWSGQEWGWYLTSRKRPPIEVGDRLYVVAHGLLRGYAPVTALRGLSFDAKHQPDPELVNFVGAWVDVDQLGGGFIDDWCICRRGDAVAVTLPDPIRGFQGWRYRWWERDAEIPFPGWRAAA